MKKTQLLLALVITLGSIAFETGHPVKALDSGNNPAAIVTTLQKAALSERVSVQAAVRGNPWINLSDGHEVITSYRGPAEEVQPLEKNEARGLSLASADFDEDGVPDLITGYAGLGGGILTLQRGNPDSIYPNSLEAQMRRSEGRLTDAPFLSPGNVVALPEAADFTGTGDFDGDSNMDVVAASRGSEKLYLVAGDGRGGFGEVQEIGLPGPVTAMQVGVINRRDGLEDVVVGVISAAGAQAVVFEGPEGALRAVPEIIALPAEATGIALGQLKGTGKGDLVIAAGKDLIVIEGRDRKLSLDRAEQVKVKKPTVNKHAFPFSIKSVELGDFTGRRQVDVALLSDEGALTILSRGEKQSQRLSQWHQERLPGKSRRMIKAGVSSLPADDLLMLGERGVRVITHSRREREEETDGLKRLVVEAGQREDATFPVEGEPVTALGMRLNGDAIDDLVMLVAGRSAVVVAPSVNGAIITVNTNLDSNDRDNVLTFREAILISNGELSVGALTAAEQAQVVGTPGSMDEIRFNITGAAASTATSGEATVAAGSASGNWGGPISSFYKYQMAVVHAIGNWFLSDVEASSHPAVQSCSYTVTPGQQNFGAKNGTGSIAVTAGAACSWSATSNAAWITITSGASGTGNGTVSYSVQMNNDHSRTGTITVAGQTVNVMQAAANEWAGNGPFGGRIEALAIDPTDTSTIYTGAFSGVFKSTDAGGTWRPSNTGLTTSIVALTIDPANANILYAGSGGGNGGVFKSTNGGSSWFPANSGLTNLDVRTLAIDSTDTNLLYAGTFNGGIFNSTNGGGSWSPASSGLASLDIRMLAIDSVNTNTVYAATFGGSGGVFKTTNGGNSWSAVNNGLTSSFIETLAIDPANTSTLYAGGSGGAFKSTNGGGSWSTVNNGLTQLDVDELTIDPANTSTLYTAIPQGVFKSTNSGGSWSPVNNGLTDLFVGALAIDPTTTSTVYLGTNGRGGGVFKSANGGGSWVPANTGLTDLSVNALAIDPSNTSTIYAGTFFGGAFKSTDSGGGWRPANTGLTDLNLRTLAIDSINTNTIYAGTFNGAFKSTNGGNSWSAVNAGLTNLGVKVLAIDRINTNTLYASTPDGIFKTTNGGGSWSAVNTGLTTLDVNALATDPVNTSTIYAGTFFEGVFKSTNGGGTWNPVNTGLTNLIVDALAIDPSNTNTIYAGTFFGGVFKSTNGGGSWSAVNNGLTQQNVSTLAVDPASSSTIYAGTRGNGMLSAGGVFKSTDGAGNWSAVNTGLTSLDVNVLTIDPLSTGRVYAGTLGGGALSALFNSCSYSVAPLNHAFTASGGTGSATVTTTPGCLWSASSNANWIVITSGATGTGNGTVIYSVAANTSPVSRNGTLLVAGQTVFISQPGSSAGCAVNPINPGQTVNAALTNADCISPIRSFGLASFFADRYSFSGTAGQQVSVS
ncbi:MAG: BACON domain-containing carbohydrate-binding protein, partial [Blastocatellia bacterium]